jgi:hypothetical protein
MAASGMASSEGHLPMTIPTLVGQACKKFGDRVAFRVERSVETNLSQISLSPNALSVVAHTFVAKSLPRRSEAADTDTVPHRFVLVCWWK